MVAERHDFNLVHVEKTGLGRLECLAAGQALGPTGGTMLPMRVQNTLNLGRPMAVRVSPVQPGWSAWLFVRAVVPRDAMWDALRETWTITREAGRHFEALQQFVVRYTRLSDAHLQAEGRDDLDLAMETDPPEDWVVLVPELDSVERVLGRFIHDFEAIRHPAEVGYPEPSPRFAREPTLEDVLGAAQPSR